MADVELETCRFNDAGKSLYKREGRSPLNILLNVIIVVFCVIFVLELSFNVLYTGIYIIDKSMSPTLSGAPSPNRSGGEFLYIEKNIEPDYGDIVVVYRETADGVKGNIIKRAVAFGGDTVEIVEGVLIVNGEEVYEPYVDPNNNTPPDNKNTAQSFYYNFPQHTVEDGCMFLLGDNRNVSSDSRSNGDYPVSDLVGVVPRWSMKLKAFTTRFYTFFNFTLWGK